MKAISCNDGQKRCAWCGITGEFYDYHDKEWGFPEMDDKRLFEKLTLESFQSGLSWRTILAKREHFRKVFHQFDFNRVALFKEKDITRLLADPGIVRHRGKIEATINNARCVSDVVKAFGSLSTFCWSYADRDNRYSQKQKDSLALNLAKDLKKHGFKFLGQTTVYAFMQAAGLVNDHAKSCIINEQVNAARTKLFV